MTSPDALAAAVLSSADLLSTIQRGEASDWEAVSASLLAMNQRDAVAVALLLANSLTPTERAKLARLVCYL